MESILGLELAEDRIRVLEIGKTQNGLELLRLDKINLSTPSIKEGIIVGPKLIAERISAFLKENNISTRKAVALIKPPYAFTRIIRLPYNLSDDQIRLNLGAELNQYQQFTSKEMAIDFKKLEEISEEGIKKVNVLFTATFKALSGSYLKTLELAGLDLVGIDVSMLSIMRALDEIDLKSSSLEVTLLMLITQKYLEMCILKGNRPRFLHSVEIDTDDLDKDRADFIDRLVSAIKLMVNFYQARFIQGEEITRIIINPWEARYNQIHALLQEKLPQIPIQLSNPLSKIYIDKDKSIDLDELRFAFSGLLGATLRLEDKAQPFNLNLLIEQKTRREYRLNQIYLLFISLTFILTIAVISLSWVVLKINILQKKITRIDSLLGQPSLELNKAMSLKEKRDILQKQIKEASIITQQLKNPFYFQDIAKTMVLTPQDLWLTDINLEEQNKNLVLTGESRTERAVFNYISSLTGSGYFEAVELVSSKGEAQSIKFIIRCTIK